jgi:VCBS repeat-containing protein
MMPSSHTALAAQRLSRTIAAWGAVAALAGLVPASRAWGGEEPDPAARVVSVAFGRELGRGAVAIPAGTSARRDGVSIRGQYGTLTIGADGSYVYTADRRPEAAADASDSAVRSDIFSYRIIDGADRSSVATLAVTLDNPGDGMRSHTAIEGNRVTALVMPTGSGGTPVATLVDGAPLPSWLRFDPDSCLLAGVPPPGSANTYRIRVVRPDQLESSLGYTLVVVPPPGQRRPPDSGRQAI